MPGSGHIFIALIYLLLFIILGICLMVLLFGKFKNRDLLKFSGGLVIVIALFSYSQMRKDSNMEIQHVGVYKLNDYPNCNDCKMKLSVDNTYTIKNSGKVIEQGSWKLETGDNYYVIELDNGRQFGYNEYSNNGKINY